MNPRWRSLFCAATAGVATLTVLGASAAEPTGTDWPPITQTAKPWTYWWWMGSAVDTKNPTMKSACFQDQ